MADREKLIELLDDFPVQMEWHSNKELADYLLANGVRLESMQATSEENTRIAELESALAECEEVVVHLRKQWQDSEMRICSMCGHYDHKRDGDVIYGNRNCGEIVGYPYCAGKFTPWIPVTERLPQMGNTYLVTVKHRYKGENEYNYDTDVATYTFGGDGYIDGCWNTYHDWDEGQPELHITHWMPLPEPPSEAMTHG